MEVEEEDEGIGEEGKMKLGRTKSRKWMMRRESRPSCGRKSKTRKR